MTRPSDLHFALIGDASYVLAKRAIEAAEAAGVPYVLGGGWAVYAHAPSVPSVDVDLFLRASEARRVRRAIAEADLDEGPGAAVELLDLDGDIELWGFGDPDLGIPSPTYRPAGVFDGRTARHELVLGHAPIEVTVPEPHALALCKVSALRNRDLAYRCFDDGRAAMLLGPVLMPQVHQRPRTFYRRKAGKDLYDLASLLALDGVPDRTADLVIELGLGRETNETVAELSQATEEMAIDIARRVRAPDPVAGVRTWAASLEALR